MNLTNITFTNEFVSNTMTQETFKQCQQLCYNAVNVSVNNMLVKLFIVMFIFLCLQYATFLFPKLKPIQTLIAKLNIFVFGFVIVYLTIKF